MTDKYENGEDITPIILDGNGMEDRKEVPEVKPPRAVPRKPKPKKLIARGKGKKGKRRRK